MKTKWLLIGVALLMTVLAIGAVACGDDDEEEDDVPTATEEQADDVADDDADDDDPDDIVLSSRHRSVKNLIPGACYSETKGGHR